MSIQLAIAGIGGRMGQALLSAASIDTRFQVTGGTARADSPLLGTDLGLLDGRAPTGRLIDADVVQASGGADAWIDFTTPQATIGALSGLEGSPVKCAIIGTTGFDESQMAEIARASQRMAIVQSGNFSLGVNVLAGLVRQAAARLGPSWDIEIIESHHRHKVDAPSGTALMLGQAAAEGRGRNHEEIAQYGRQGQNGLRKTGDIGYSAIRAGGIIGDHEVILADQDEILTLGHKAGSRTIFAKGALAAAAWAVTQKPGLYSMAEVLGL